MKNICGDDNCLHCQAYMKPWHTSAPARDGRTPDEIYSDLIKEPVEIKRYPLKRDGREVDEEELCAKLWLRMGDIGEHRAREIAKIAIEYFQSTHPTAAGASVDEDLLKKLAKEAAKKSTGHKEYPNETAKARDLYSVAGDFFRAFSDLLAQGLLRTQKPQKEDGGAK